MNPSLWIRNDAPDDRPSETLRCRLFVGKKIFSSSFPIDRGVDDRGSWWVLHRVLRG